MQLSGIHHLTAITTNARQRSAAQRGAGGVHHVAFRLPDADYAAWADRLRQLRIASSGPVDRFYFRSLYFREPNGILFEIATDGPGFATDEPLASLGGEAFAAAVPGIPAPRDRGWPQAAVSGSRRGAGGSSTAPGTRPLPPQSRSALSSQL
jgi:hypothetical protein